MSLFISFSFAATIKADDAAAVTFVAVLPISASDEIGDRITTISTGSPIAAKTAVVVIVAVPGTPTVPSETNKATNISII